jgi:hypothetical protein
MPAVEPGFDLLRLSDDRSQSCAEVGRIARLLLTEIESKVADLGAAPPRAQAAYRPMRARTIDECRIIEALGPVA